MNGREMTWLDAAIFTLENNSKVWMTAPELVREIEAKGYRRLRSKYNQAVRTLRATLNVQSRKENSIFLRNEVDFHVLFALKKRFDEEPDNVPDVSTIPKRFHHPSERRLSTKEKATKQATKSQKPITNGLSSSSSPPPSPQSPGHTLTPPHILTIEIDPTIKPTCNNKDSAGGFCLPSPLHSLLGPSKTLHVLSESVVPSSHRPVRRVRKKKVFDPENVTPLSNGVPEDATVPPPPVLPKMAEILRVVVCHRLPSLQSDVTCVRYEPDSKKKDGDKSEGVSEKEKEEKEQEEDPCSVQGQRSSTGSLEIDPDYVMRSDTEDEYDSEDESEDMDDDEDLETYDESGSMSDYDSESDSDTLNVQPTPTNQMFVRKPKRRYTGTYNDITFEPSPPVEPAESESSTPKDNKPKEEAPATTTTTTTQRYSQRERRASETQQKFQPPPVRTSNSTTVANSRFSASDLNKIQRVDQRRSMSSLLAPTSPLVNENMKTLLNMDAFNGLTVGQKKRLLTHLPSVDRGDGTSLSEESLTNSFFSSALREWQERIALGMYTAEYRARQRGEEKRRASLRPDDPWKHKHFEQYWGEKSSDESESLLSAPYYPHLLSSTSHHQETLRAITDGYCRKVPESETPVTPPPPTPPPPLPSLTPPSQSTVDKTRVPVEPAPSTSGSTTKGGVKVERKGPKGAPKVKTSSIPASQKNHVAKKISQAKQINKRLLPSLLTNKLPIKAVNRKPALKRLGTNSHTPPQTVLPKVQFKKQRASVPPGQFLTRLPPKTPYQALLTMLIHVSKGHSYPSPKSSYLPPLVEHNHAVFHDHFALLSSEHVPTEFSLPVKSLPVQVPLEVFQSCMKQKAIHSDHCYSRVSGGTPKIDNQSLKLSLPRSLIRTSEGCACGGQPLVICSECRSLYHSVCSQSTLCQTCSTLASLNMS